MPGPALRGIPEQRTHPDEPVEELVQARPARRSTRLFAAAAQHAPQRVEAHPRQAQRLVERVQEVGHGEQ